MYSRLEIVSGNLEWTGLTHKSYYRKMLQRIAGGASTEEFAALKTLVDVLEPVKNYTREETATYEATNATPLNRVVDVALPDSDVARHFENAVTAFVGNSCKDPAGSVRLRTWLLKWQANDAALQPLAQRSFFVKEVAPNSQDLSAIAGIGLAALDAIAKGTPLFDDARAQATARIADASKGKAQLLLIPAPAVQKLVDAASSGGACAAKN